MTTRCDECHFTARFKPEVKYCKFLKHSDLRPWSCEFPGCHYQAKIKIFLNIHKRIHETEPELRKPFPCTFGNCNQAVWTIRRVVSHFWSLWHQSPSHPRVSQARLLKKCVGQMKPGYRAENIYSTSDLKTMSMWSTACLL